MRIAESWSVGTRPVGSYAVLILAGLLLPETRGKDLLTEDAAVDTAGLERRSPRIRASPVGD